MVLIYNNRTSSQIKVRCPLPLGELDHSQLRCWFGFNSSIPIGTVLQIDGQWNIFRAVCVLLVILIPRGGVSITVSIAVTVSLVNNDIIWMEMMLECFSRDGSIVEAKNEEGTPLSRRQGFSPIKRKRSSPQNSILSALHFQLSLLLLVSSCCCCWLG